MIGDTLQRVEISIELDLPILQSYQLLLEEFP